MANLIENATYRSFISSGENGVFGVVRSDNEGTVEINSLERPKLGVTVPVANGAFSAASLEAARGRFVARFFVDGELKAGTLLHQGREQVFLQF